MNILGKKFIYGFILVGLVFTYPHKIHAAESNQQIQINELTEQIRQIQAQIAEYESQIETNSSKATTLKGEINTLERQISKIQLAIRSLQAEISKTSLEIKETEKEISQRQSQLQTQLAALGKYIRDQRQLDDHSLTEILFQNDSLSDFFSDIKNLSTAQNRVQGFIASVQEIKNDLESRNEDLRDKKSDLEELRGIQDSERASLQSSISRKNELFKETKGEEARYQKLVQKSKQDLAKIQEQISNLQKNGVSVQDAVTYGKLAAERSGIRPAFLLAILEVETGLGRNVGTGNWMDDMVKCYLRLGKPQRAETEKNAFLKITSQLGIDPNSVKVSKEPNYGCGGAMGPAQFLASTWLAYQERVAAVTGHNPPNPWNIEDAFTAAAIKLAQGGASSKTRQGEIGAAKAYISGKSSCTTKICNYYSNAVLSKAAIIEQNL